MGALSFGEITQRQGGKNVVGEETSAGSPLIERPVLSVVHYTCMCFVSNRLGGKVFVI